MRSAHLGRQLPFRPAFLFLFLSHPFLNVIGQGDGFGEPADVLMSGQRSECFGGGLNGVYAYQGDTADGKRYYSHKTGSVYQSVGFPVAYLFFDKDPDNGKKPSCGAGAIGNNQWHISGNKPDTTAAQDLDGDNDCISFASLLSPDTSGSLAPPACAYWAVACSGENYGFELAFQPICEQTAPDWTYTYPAEWLTVNAGCGTGIARQRRAVEACPARGGCDCKNKRATLPIDSEEQEPCPADLRMSGVREDDCDLGPYSGVYAYQGITADGKRYYSHNTGTSPSVLYLYYDKDSDGGKDPGKCGGTEGNNLWLIDVIKPSLTEAQDLDSNNKCGAVGWTQPDTSGSLTPPESAVWVLGCSASGSTLELSFQPICEQTAPDWTYRYPAEWSVVNAGCGTGIGRQRTEVGFCSARGGCNCKNKRAPPGGSS